MKPMRMLAVTALLASSHLVYGQDETPVMTANVPFAFTAAGVSLPAGRYLISRAQEGQLWKLHTFGHVDVYLMVTPREVRQAPATSVLLFDHDVLKRSPLSQRWPDKGALSQSSSMKKVAPRSSPPSRFAQHDGGYAPW
jgi:hypothetical protein